MNQNQNMSEFARSLYVEQQQQEQEATDRHAEDARGGGMRRQRSTRRSSAFARPSERNLYGGGGGSSSGGGGDSGMAAAAAAVQQLGDHMFHADPSYGGGGGVEDNPIVADNDEVLEQYRIMAQLEAQLRVKDNTGFDMTEYQERRRSQTESAGTEGYYKGMIPKPLVPEPRGVTSLTSTVPEEPPLLQSSRLSRRFLQVHPPPRVPELCIGGVVRGPSTLPDGEHLVRCLGCRVNLRVNMMASLVSCPECSTVSPACALKR